MKVYQNTQYRPINSVEHMDKQDIVRKEPYRNMNNENDIIDNEMPVVQDVNKINMIQPMQLLHNSFKKMPMVHIQSTVGVSGVQKK